MNTVDYEQLQGFVLSGYKKQTWANYYLLTINDPNATLVWLNTLIRTETISHGKAIKDNRRANIAFSAAGLNKLAIPNLDLDSFDHAFLEGMNSKRRANILGDVDFNSKEHWQWGNENPIDILLMSFASEQDDLSKFDQSLQEQFKKANLKIEKILHAPHHPSMTKNGIVREHFGFADGVSQPAIDGLDTTDRHQTGAIPPVATGEFLLGYTNEYDSITQVPSAGKLGTNFGKNGSYLVFRQLEQNVPAFKEYAARMAKDHNIEAELIEAKIVGRWPSGARVTPNQQRDPNTIGNDFDFTDDKKGYGCPIGAHIRRSNPRGVDLAEQTSKSIAISNRHRILRRGRSYGTPYQADSKANEARGLIFICLNANIERQFEFIQHSWINNVQFAGLNNEHDALIGIGEAGENQLTIPDKNVRLLLKDIEPFVRMRGGEYFFLPSMSALKMLAALADEG